MEERMEDNQCPETCKPVPSACEENPEGLLGYNPVDGNYLKEKPPPWDNTDHDCPADSEAVPGSCSTVKVELAEGSDREIREDCSRQVECKLSTNTNAEVNEVEQSFTTLPVHPSQSLSYGGDCQDSGSSIPPVFENNAITGASVITLEEIGMPSVDSNGPGIQFNQSEIKDSKAGAIPKRKKKKKMLSVCEITETVLPLDPDATAYFSIDPNLQVPGDFQASLSSVVAQAATGRSDKSGDIPPSMEPTGSKCENSSEYIPKSCSQKGAEELSKSGNLDACVQQGQVTKTKKRKKKKAAKASSIVPLTDPSTSFTGFAEIQNSSSQNSYLTQAAKDLTEAMKYLTVSIDQRPDSELKGAVRDLTKAVKGLTNNMEELLSQRNTTSFVISSNLQENISVQEEHSPEVYASNIPDLPEHLAEKQALSNIPDLPEHLAEKQALSNIPDLPSSVESGTQNVNLAEVKRIIKKKKKYGKTAPLPFSSLVDYPFDLEADFKLPDQIFTENIENKTMSVQDTDNTLRESVPTMSKKKKKPKKKSQKQNVDSGASGMEGVQATLLKTSDFASGGLVRSSEGTCSTTKHLEEEPPLKADFSSKAMNANTCLGEASSGTAPPNINPSTCMSLPAGSDSQNNSVKLKGCSTKVTNQQRITVILTKGQKRRQKQALKKQLPKKDKTTGASLDTASKKDEHGKKVLTKTAPKSKPLVVQSTSSEASIAVGDGETRKKKLQKRKKRVEVGLQQQDQDLRNSAPSCGVDESSAVERPNMYTLLKMGLLQPGGKIKKVIPKDQGSDSSDSVLPGDSLSEMYGSPDSSGGGRYGSSEGPPAKGRQRQKKRSNQHQILQSPADGANAMRVKPGSSEGRPDFLPHGQGRSGSPRLHSPNTQHTNRNWANDGAGQYSRRRNDSPGQPGRRDVQVGDGQNGRAEGKRGGGAGRQNQEKKPVFNKHWTMDMVSQGLKKGFLVEGAIRVNPKNYEDAYIPCPDGLSDIYISGFSNRNRALNGDIVAVLVNDPSEWKVHMDSFEQYEANLLKQMEDLKVTENEGEKESVKGDQDVIIESEETTAVIVEDDPIGNCSSQDSKSNCVLGKPAVSQSDVPDETVNTVNQSECTAGKSHSVSQSGTFLQSVVDCATSGSSRSQQNVTDATMVIDSPQKNKENRTPRKDNSESKTPGSMNRNYTSVKDVLTQNGCSPVAQRLFSREDSKASTSSKLEDSMSQKFLQKTGKVLAIIEKKHSRACSGHIKPMKDRNKRHALFCPTDHRCPRIMVPMSDCPADFLERPDDHSNTLFIARITDWPDTSQFAHGNLARSLGEAGLIEPETEAMLIECDIDYSEFSPEALESLPKESPWVIPPDELSRRKDFRGHCIFTIDPATARDLDDALSCEDLGNGLYEVGVHIADVSYFLQENTALDTVASKRATSVYLVQKVVPMLPRLLCEQLCSLNPYHDRLTFSVIWHMNQDGEIQGEWFGRSVIRSCVKLSYDHAQGFIDHPDKEFSDEELPPISNGFSVAKIREKVLNLHKIAQKLRKNRFDNGALRLDQIKLQFSLDKDTGLPNGYSVYKQRESNKLVEEFMLLANMAVAHKILRTYPEIALLRRHPPPQSKMIDDLCDLCESLGVPVDTSSAGALQRSLDEYVGEDDFSIARLQVLVSLCSKPMQNARYFCTGITDDEGLFHHYALNVPVYTHFTSPIRRYPDVIVHRLLGAALGYCDPPDKAKEAVQRQAEHCNDKKLASKTVQERSSDVFFSVFVKEVGPLEEAAMVMGVLNRSFDVFVLRLGVTKRVYCEKLPVDSFDFRKDKKRPSLTLVWPATETNPAQVTQEITIFTMVKAILKADGGPLRWSASILHPGLKEK